MLKKSKVCLLGVFFISIISLFSSTQHVGARELTTEPFVGSAIVTPGEGFIPVIGELQKENIYSRATTAPTIVTYGPFYYDVKGSTLNSWVAKNTSSLLNLDAASRKAVLRIYKTIDENKTYKIKWYNRVESLATSVKGTIVDVTCTN